MKDLRYKIGRLKEFLTLDAELKSELVAIVKDTYDYFCSGVVSYDISEDGSIIDCLYDYTCRGELAFASCYIPVRWLDDGFDFKAAYAALQLKK